MSPVATLDGIGDPHSSSDPLLILFNFQCRTLGSIIDAMAALPKFAEAPSPRHGWWWRRRWMADWGCCCCCLTLSSPPLNLKNHWATFCFVTELQHELGVQFRPNHKGLAREATESRWKPRVEWVVFGVEEEEEEERRRRRFGSGMIWCKCCKSMSRSGERKRLGERVNVVEAWMEWGMGRG